MEPIRPSHLTLALQRPPQPPARGAEALSPHSGERRFYDRRLEMKRTLGVFSWSTGMSHSARMP